MIDGYIIMNRKSDLIIKIFIFNICIVIILIIWGINALEYQKKLKFHSKISNFNSYYLLEVLVPVKEVNQVIKKNKLLIDDVSYDYNVNNISSDLIVENNINYQKIYLSVNNLDDSYKINNLILTIKIPISKKKILKYFIE